ncbi:MAG TPA: fumarylacetoacetase [Streptosporangiaceae bacterium]
MAAAWLGIGREDPFGLQTLPYGSYSAAHHLGQPRAGVRIGDRILDLGALTSRLLPGRAHLFSGGNLDLFLAAGHRAWAQVRAALVLWLSQDIYRDAIEDLLVPVAGAELHLPFTVGDYADFYASEHHASNVGQIFGRGSSPLPPNWRHLPAGYHGRASSVIVSHTPVRRPCGQFLPPDAAAPAFGPSARLDFEAELGFVAGMHSVLSEPIPVTRFAEHVFGACLVNDWSARDLQTWESVPLGPFLAKSFATTISPWVVPLAALEHARIRPPSRDTGLLPYLAESQDWGLDIDFEVTINEQVVSRPRYREMHWSPAQMLAHLTAGGASVRTGDLFASGTVSGPDPGQYACLLELTWNGTKPVTLDDGSTRAWLEDNDEVGITATAAGPDGTRVGFGQAAGQVIPAIQDAVG